MPSSPTRSMRHYSTTLQNMTLSFQQDDDAFVGAKAAPFVSVDKKEGRYYVYDQGEWQRLQVAKRGTAEESAGGGWTHSTDTYHCERHAVHHDEDWADVADADEAFNVDEDNAEWLSNQANMHVDYIWQSVVMQPATWTTDYDGVSGTPSTNEVKQWDQSASTPQADVVTLQNAIHALVGRFANVMVVGMDVHAEVVVHSEVRDAIKYTDKTFLGKYTLQQFADYFGVDHYIVARGIYNNANKGATKTMTEIVNAKDMWLGYSNPNPGLKKMSAAYTYAFKGPEGVGQDGMVTSKFDIESRKVTRYEIELYHDVKIVAADAGAFVDDLVA